MNKKYQTNPIFNGVKYKEKSNKDRTIHHNKSKDKRKKPKKHTE